MASFDSNLVISAALAQFFESHNLGEQGGLNKNWAKLKVGPFYIPFPNTAERKRALMFHDMHHVVTGYESNWQGEAEIGAWEVASDCGDYRAAWVLDLGALFLGLFLFPKKTFKAFVRGRRTTNLYQKIYTEQQVGQMTIAEVQSKLRLDKANGDEATSSEISAFVKWSFIAALMWGLPFLIFYAVIICLIFW